MGFFKYPIGSLHCDFFIWIISFYIKREQNNSKRKFVTEFKITFHNIALISYDIKVHKAIQLFYNTILNATEVTWFWLIIPQNGSHQ